MLDEPEMLDVESDLDQNHCMMSTIQAILDPDADGTLHLPLPESLRHCRVKVEATLVPAPLATPMDTETRRREDLIGILAQIRKRDPFKHIENPVNWQREMREDRPLPGRS